MATSKTFLELCRELARESGAVSSSTTSPSAVTGQTGRSARLVEDIQNAWIAIQNMHEGWRFRRKEFDSKSLIASTGSYTFTSFSITDGYRWRGSRSENDLYTIYDPSVGVSDEGALRFIPWDDFKRRYRRGTQVDGRPVHVSIDPTDNLAIGPKPDKAYTFSGEYTREAQELAANTDVPICPGEFHMGIVWYALGYLHEFDEAPLQVIAAAKTKADQYLRSMASSQLPSVTMAGSKLA